MTRRTDPAEQPVLADDGRVLYAPNPRDLFTLATLTPGRVAPTGRLFIGGSWRAYPRGAEFDVVVSVCGHREGACPPPAHAMHIDHPLHDDAGIDVEEVEQLVEEVVQLVEAGYDVLTRCYTGQNRSGLVTVLAMRQLYGMTSREAIDHLREVRAATVLCNPAFEAYVLSLDEVAA